MIASGSRRCSAHGLPACQSMSEEVTSALQVPDSHIPIQKKVPFKNWHDTYVTRNG